MMRVLAGVTGLLWAAGLGLAYLILRDADQWGTEVDFDMVTVSPPPTRWIAFCVALLIAAGLLTAVLHWRRRVRSSRRLAGTTYFAVLLGLWVAMTLVLLGFAYAMGSSPDIGSSSDRVELVGSGFTLAVGGTIGVAIEAYRRREPS